MKWAGIGVGLVLVGMVGVHLASVSLAAAPEEQSVFQPEPDTAAAAAPVVAPGGAPAGAKPAAPAAKPAVPSTPPAPRQESLSELFNEPVEPPSGLQLASTPNMFGDVLLGRGSGPILLVGPASPPNNDIILGEASLPLAGGSRRMKIADNDLPLTEDRVFFMYNHFQNALAADASGLDPGLGPRLFSVDRYTVGFEKTLADRLWSVEVRMPLANGLDYAGTDFGVAGGSVGNLAVLFKRMLYQSDNTAVAAGLGIDTPTGSDVQGFADTTSFVMRNQAVHLMPYVGLLKVPSERLFYAGFLQVDVPANGNRVDYHDTYAGSGTFGTLSEQTLMYVDFMMGYWLLRDRRGSLLNGLAALAELHYTTSLQDLGLIAGTPSALRFTFASAAGPTDILNLTVGLHADLGSNTCCRVGGVFPLSSDENRAFDAEVQVQLERRF